MLSPALEAEVKLPALLSDNMLLQANQPAPIWGIADSGERVKVSFANQWVDTTADANGKWQVKLNPLAADTCGNMTVEGKNKISITNRANS